MIEAYSMVRNPATLANTSKDKDYRYFGNSGKVRMSKHRKALAQTWNKTLLHGHEFWVNDQHRRLIRQHLPRLALRIDLHEPVTAYDFNSTQRLMYPQTVQALKAAGWNLGDDM